MAVAAMIIGAFFFSYLTSAVFSRMWNKNLEVTVEFTKEAVTAGMDSDLKETIVNRKWLFLPFLQVGFQTHRNLKFAEDENVSISVGAKHISFTIGNTVVISRRLEGEFLNYRKSIPENFRYTLTVERSDILSTIDRVSLIVSEKNSSPVRVTFNDGNIDCICVTPIGKAEDICICEGSGEGLEIGFNDRYLSDALKAAASEKLNICINTASSPCIISAADGSDKFTYMILPVRLRAGV
ncbi:MAG: hypothetical protein J6B06_07385 [Lachnospiraceae bacterium]|nr:hypothetical protein [Lachnospiraceae bacterium]